ncbi:MAG: trypsin-like serine protease [Bacteroidales bacterium]
MPLSKTRETIPSDIFRMIPVLKHILAFLAVFLISVTAFSQKVQVRVIKTQGASVSDWQILDENYIPVFSGNEYFREDTVYFGLEPNKRFFFQVSVSELIRTDTILFSLAIENEPLLVVSANTGTGDHLFPFFTGSAPGAQAKITGGTNADISQFPWQIYFISGIYECGGVIISNRWVLTAAHCTHDDLNNPIPAIDMTVVVGANDPFTVLQGKAYSVSNVIVNPGYSHSTLVNDIALLRLSDTINYINAKPIKIISASDSASGVTDPGVLAWITGYGLIQASPPLNPTTLQKVQLPLVSNQQASVVWPTIPSTDLMAGYYNGGKDACSGDSGGPLVVPVNNEYKLAGLVSWGSSNCDTYGAYTRVSIFDPWITANTGIEITFSGPLPKGDSIICQGIGSSTYTVQPVSGTLSYEWRLLPSAAGTITANNSEAVASWNTAYTGPAQIAVRITKSTGSSDWSVLYAHLAKNTRLLSQTNDTVLCAEQPANIVTSVEGYNLDYSWFKNNAPLTSATSGTIHFANVLTDASGNYYCQVSGSCGNLTTSTISYTVLPVTRINSISPDTTVAFGGNVTLKVQAVGHNLTYQWQKNDTLVGSGTAPSLSLTGVNANAIGLYRMDLKGTCGEAVSKTAYVYVTNKNYSGQPQIYVWPTLVNNEFKIALGDNQSYNIRLYTYTGRLLKEVINARYQTVINTSKLTQGLYIVVIYNTNFKKSVKLVRE